MKIKNIGLVSTATMLAISSAHAADAVVVAEPEPVEYVRVCDAYGAGFFYIPGTETCLKISGYLRYDASAGDDVYDGSNVGANDNETWYKRTRATVRFDARSETELGTLRSYIETRFQFTNGSQDGATIPHAYIELGGFRLGTTDSQFTTWTNSAGNVIRDDVIDYGGDQTNQMGYTFTGGNGFSGVIGLEQGDSRHVIDDYMPDVVAGLKFEQGWGAVSGVVGYDSVEENFAGKLRLNVKFTDKVSAFVMGGYQSDSDEAGYYNAWQGDWAVWGGLSAKVADKATINSQVAYQDEGTLAVALNVAYELVPGFVITPELDYTSFGDDRGNRNDDAFGGIVRFQRNF